ncbi:DUF3943 domain-containing protein [Inquilinus sp. KBS0705]|nr:DUF3943 domain-containing protein [Inquilinus sp. KBS0705]
MTKTSTCHNTRFFALLLLVMLAAPFYVSAQTATDAQKLITDTVAKAPPKPRSYLPPPPQQKRFGRAAFELLGAEVVPQLFDRFVLKEDFAKTSFKTFGHNLNPNSWTWDSDLFVTNQFAHPYHGSLYFSAFRTNGYSFWQSTPAAFAGSYLWETFGEKDPPSPNDFINTSFGGIVLGEMTYRFANKIINNRQRGFKRQVNEVVGLLINPMNGLNRIIDGKWGKVYGNPTDRDSTRLTAEFDLGIRKFGAKVGAVTNYGQFGWFGRARLMYGNRYKDYRVPFSNIYANVEFGNDDSSGVNSVNVYGSLAGWEIRSNKDLQHLAILSANYDYISNEAFFYGGQSVKMNIFSQYDVSSRVKFTTSVNGGPVLIAAIPNHGVFRGRAYDYTMGGSWGGGAGLNLMDKFTVGVDYRGAWLLTVNGNQSHYVLHAVTGEVRYQFTKALSVATEPGYLNLRSTYKDADDVTRIYPYLRLSARYSVDLYR